MESMRQATIAARGAVNALHTVTAICVNLAPRVGVLADEQRAARSQLIEDVISIQRQVSLLKERAETLLGKLTEFRPGIDAQAVLRQLPMRGKEVTFPDISTLKAYRSVLPPE